jgi:hypothetical protein
MNPRWKTIILHAIQSLANGFGYRGCNSLAGQSGEFSG